MTYYLRNNLLSARKIENLLYNHEMDLRGQKISFYPIYYQPNQTGKKQYLFVITVYDLRKPASTYLNEIAITGEQYINNYFMTKNSFYLFEISQLLSPALSILRIRVNGAQLIPQRKIYLEKAQIAVAKNFNQQGNNFRIIQTVYDRYTRVSRVSVLGLDFSVKGVIANFSKQNSDKIFFGFNNSLMVMGFKNQTTPFIEGNQKLVHQTLLILQYIYNDLYTRSDCNIKINDINANYSPVQQILICIKTRETQRQREKTIWLDEITSIQICKNIKYLWKITYIIWNNKYWLSSHKYLFFHSKQLQSASEESWVLVERDAIKNYQLCILKISINKTDKNFTLSLL